MYKAIEEKVRKIENKYGSLENFVVSTTISKDKHKLKMKGQFKDLRKVYESLNDLEIADLCDFKNFMSEEDGELCKER